MDGWSGVRSPVQPAAGSSEIVIGPDNRLHFPRLTHLAGGLRQTLEPRRGGDPEIGRDFIEWIRNREIELDDLTLERELVAQKRADLVLDAPNNPRSYKPLMAAGQVTSYVVAPILPAGRVVGLLHADHGATTREVDVSDRDVLWAFAEGFGRLYERVVLLERIDAQRRSIRERAWCR